MKVARAVVAQVVGLFVADWAQSAVILAILAAGWLAFRRVGGATLVFIVVLLAGQMAWFAGAEGRRIAAAGGGK